MRRTHIALTTLLAALLVLAATAVPAQASTSKAKDGDDTATPLDLASVKLKTAGKKIVATISTHQPFTDDDLAAPSAMGIDFRLDAKTLRGVAVRVVDGVFKGQVCTFEDGGPVLGNKCSDVSAARVNDHTLMFTIKRSRITKAPVLRWRAGAFYFVGDCQSDPVQCIDTIPNGRAAYKRWKV